MSKDENENERRRSRFGCQASSAENHTAFANQRSNGHGLQENVELQQLNFHVAHMFKCRSSGVSPELAKVHARKDEKTVSWGRNINENGNDMTQFGSCLKKNTTRHGDCLGGSKITAARTVVLYLTE